MTVTVKICGLSTAETIHAAVYAGASHIGFVFFEKSPRNVTAGQAGILAEKIPASIIKTGVFVNPTDEFLEQTLAHVTLDLIQLHGTESPKRVTEVKNRFSLPVMKAISIASPDDVAKAKTYENSADMLLFDAKAPASLENSLPGGNGEIFDWILIKNTIWTIPWMLSGGLDEHNVQSAINISGASIVDISSGVENTPGGKNIAKIKAFISEVKNT